MPDFRHKKRRPETSLDVEVVEARGVEPLSASPPPAALHAYPVFEFNSRLPDRQGRPTAIPVRF